MRKNRSVLCLLCIVSLLAGLFGAFAPAVRAADPWVNKADVSWIDSSKKLVAFTFDDGPVGTAPGVSSVNVKVFVEKLKLCTVLFTGSRFT